MLGTLFLLVSFSFGAAFLSHFRLFRGDALLRFCSAFLVGTLLATWWAYALTALFGLNTLTLGLTILSLAVWSGALGFRAAWVEMRQAGFDRSQFWARVILSLFILPFFLFGFQENSDGSLIFRGYYVDLSYHIAIARTFLDQPGLPPINLQVGGIPLYYHYLIDFHSALLLAGGLGLLSAFNIPQIFLAIALITALTDLFSVLLGSARKIFFASILFLLGHDAFFALVFSVLGYRAYIPYERDLSWNNLWNLAYHPFLHFLSPVMNFFQPQRPLLFAFPLALTFFSLLADMYVRREPDRKKLTVITLLVALLPLFHGHAFLMLATVLLPAWLAAGIRRESLAPLILAGCTALPQLLYLHLGMTAPGFSAFDVDKLFQSADTFHFSSYAPLSYLLVWVRACGFSFILGNAAIFFLLQAGFRKRIFSERRSHIVLVLYGLFLPYFVLINFYRFSPWWGDSNKFFLFWNISLCCLAAELCFSISRAWARRAVSSFVLLAAAVVPSVVQYPALFFAPQTLFSGCERAVGEWVRLNIPRDAIFGAADDVVHPITAFAGRVNADGSYTATSFGVPQQVKDELWRVFRAGDRELMRKYKLTHFYLSNREEQRYHPNIAALRAVSEPLFEMTCQNEKFSILKIEQGLLDQPPAPLSATYLSLLKPYYREQRWGELQYDRNVLQNPITLGGRIYEHGLGTHATSRIEYALRQKYSRFQATVGIDDSQPAGSVVFRVTADDVELYRSPLMKKGDAPAAIDIDIRHAAQLKLFVDDGGDGWKNDNAVWADAKVIP